MAVFTTSDRDAVKTALITAATEGVASVSVGGQAVATYTLEQLHKLLAVIQSDLAGANANSLGGMRIRKTITQGAG